MLFGELKMRFLPTAPIHLVWFIRNIFDCLDVSKCVFNLKYDLHSCCSYLVSKANTTQVSINFLDFSQLLEDSLKHILTWSLY
jgi:hypothetical protein